MSKDLDGITRGDLEQLLEDHTLRTVGAVEKMRGEMHTDLGKMRTDINDFRTEVRERFDRFEKETDADIRALYHEMAELKTRIVTLEKKQSSSA